MKYIIDLTFIIIFSLWFRLLSIFKSKSDTVLVIQIVALGDLICASSFYRQLHLTGKRICSVCRSKYYDAYAHANPYVDEWILFDDSYTSIIGKYRFFKKLYLHNIGFTYDLTGSYFSKWLGYSTGAKMYGIDLRKSGFNWLYDTYIKPDYGTHIVDTYFKLLDNDVYNDNRTLEFWGTYPIDHPIFSESVPIVALGIGAQVISRRWSNQGFIDVINYLTDTYHYHVVLIGNELDSINAKHILAGVHNQSMVYDFTGATSVGQAGWIISKSKLLVSNDSGLVHVGASCGVPTLAIFGPGYPKQWGPYQQPDSIIRTGICDPCGNNPTCKHTLCLLGLDSQLVIEAINAKLEDIQ